MTTITPKAIISQIFQDGCDIRISFWVGCDKLFSIQNGYHPGDGFTDEELEQEIQRLLDTIDDYPQHVYELDPFNPEDCYYFAQCAHDWYIAGIKGYKVYDVKTSTHALKFARRQKA